MIRFFIALIIYSVFAYPKQTVITSIPPVAVIIQEIGGNKIDTVSMISKGDSPHTFEPKPSQLKALSSGMIYFTIGVEFESVWLTKFRSINPNMLIVPLDENIKKITATHNHHTHGSHCHTQNDPHIWTSPKNLVMIAQAVMQTLSSYDSKNKDFYNKRFTDLKKRIIRTDKEIRKIISKSQPKTFIAQHPSWGYFAQEYRLTQLAIEHEGDAPSPKYLQQLINNARKLGIKTVVASPNSSDKLASIVAQAIKTEVSHIDPLSAHILDELIRLAQAIKSGKTQ